MNDFTTIEQLYFVSLRYHSRKFDEIRLGNRLICNRFIQVKFLSGCGFPIYQHSHQQGVYLEGTRSKHFTRTFSFDSTAIFKL